MTPDTTSKIEELVQQVQAIADPGAREVSLELVKAVMSLHQAAIERMLKIVEEKAPGITGSIGADDLLSRVLVLHGLHPDGFETRLSRAIDRLQRHFDSRGAAIEVLEAGPDALRIRFTGKRSGAGATARVTIENAIYEAVPEVGELIIEGIPAEHEAGFVPLASLMAGEPA